MGSESMLSITNTIGDQGVFLSQFCEQKKTRIPQQQQPQDSDRNKKEEKKKKKPEENTGFLQPRCQSISPLSGFTRQKEILKLKHTNVCPQRQVCS